MSTHAAFDAVRIAARGLPDVEECLYYGTPALKVHGQMFVCIASHRSAEPDTLVVRMSKEMRDAIIAEQPDVYYLKEHYVGYDSVLVRLRKVSKEALHDLVCSAHRYMATKGRKVSAVRRASAPAPGRPGRGRRG